MRRVALSEFSGMNDPAARDKDHHLDAKMDGLLVADTQLLLD